MLQISTDILTYDGSYLGFLTTVDHVFRTKKLPQQILTPETSLTSLFLGEEIVTNKVQAYKIERRLKQRLRSDNFQFIQNGWLSLAEEKEICLMQAIDIALISSDTLLNHLGHPAILTLEKAIKNLLGEVHVLTGFVRFEISQNILYGTIKPKNQVLFHLCPHFLARFPNQIVMLYDRTHQLLAIMRDGQTQFLEQVEPPVLEKSITEQERQKQWQTFLSAVTIDERINLKNQRSHLPLRFRTEMTEFK